MGDLVAIGNTARQGRVILPAIAAAKKGAWIRFLEFFTVNIRHQPDPYQYDQRRFYIQQRHGALNFGKVAVGSCSKAEDDHDNQLQAYCAHSVQVRLR